MVEIIPGIDGKAVRIGIERGLLQFWIVADAHTKKGGQLILVPLREFSSGLSAREYHGENWTRGPRSMSVTRSGSSVTLRQYAPSGAMLGSITVESHRLNNALAKFVCGFQTSSSTSDRNTGMPQSANTSPRIAPSAPVQSQNNDCHLSQVTPEWFWRTFRHELSEGCTESALSSSRAWTKVVIAAATRVCELLGNGVIVQHEKPRRLDVSARLPNEDVLAIAFESELAPVGYMGRIHDKTWREEFVKLCDIPARLRVLSSYFMPGTGGTFERFLRQQLDELDAHFRNAAPGEWLLIFGSEDSTRDPDQPWLVFSLKPDFTLVRVPDEGHLFCPRRIARGLDVPWRRP